MTDELQGSELFYADAEHLNSGPLSFMTVTLQSESFPKPLNFLKNKKFVFLNNCRFSGNCTNGTDICHLISKPGLKVYSVTYYTWDHTLASCMHLISPVCITVFVKLPPLSRHKTIWLLLKRSFMLPYSFLIILSPHPYLSLPSVNFLFHTHFWNFSFHGYYINVSF